MRSNSPTAPLPPPVIASAALRPDACNVEINCCHAASDGLMVRVWFEAGKYPANGERQLGRSQQSCLAEETMSALPRHPAANIGAVEDRFFTLRNFRLTDGAVMPEATIAYETYGRLAPPNGPNGGRHALPRARGSTP